MDRQTEIRNLTDHLTQLWRDMVWAREQGRWDRYWALRRSWLARGRLLSLLVEEQREHDGAQLELLDGGVGRHHDSPAA